MFLLISFRFDIIVVLLFISYLIYGFFSGGHKQILFSINLLLPFIIIYYLGNQIAGFFIKGYDTSPIYEMISQSFSISKNTVFVLIIYLIMYIFIFVGTLFLSFYLKRKYLNENMRLNLGRYNSYLGAIFAFINGYVLIYILVLPSFALSFVQDTDVVTYALLDNPPPFSRIARTAKTAVPVKGVTDSFDDFETLLSADGIKTYYDEAIYKYQEKLIGESGYEAQFDEDIDPYLSAESKDLLNDRYNSYFGTDIPADSYGISVILTQKDSDGTFFYEDIYADELLIEDTLDTSIDIISAYEKSVIKYNSLLKTYDINSTFINSYNIYVDDLSVYNNALANYQLRELDAMLEDEVFEEEFLLTKPVLINETNLVYSEELVEKTIEPIIPEETDAITDAYIFVETYDKDEYISKDLKTLGQSMAEYAGLIEWYIVDLDGEMAESDDPEEEVSFIINSFIDNYDDIMENTTNTETVEKLTKAKMGIDIYSTFTQWLDCVQQNSVLVDSADDLSDAQYRCTTIDLEKDIDFDLINNTTIVSTYLLAGNNITYVIMQYKYDYEAGVFEEPLGQYDAVNVKLDSAKALVEEYLDKYRIIADSINLDISMTFKIGISVIKYNMDVYDTLDNSVLMSAIANDVGSLCFSSTTGGYTNDVEVCDSGMPLYASEIYLKAYFMIDDDGEKKVYDKEEITLYIADVEKAIDDGVITKENVVSLSDQIAFYETEDGYTMLEYLFIEEYITVEGLRELSNDKYDLFSDDFKYECRNLIR